MLQFVHTFPIALIHMIFLILCILHKLLSRTRMFIVPEWRLNRIFCAQMHFKLTSKCIALYVQTRRPQINVVFDAFRVWLNSKSLIVFLIAAVGMVINWFRTAALLKKALRFWAGFWILGSIKFETWDRSIPKQIIRHQKPFTSSLKVNEVQQHLASV